MAVEHFLHFSKTGRYDTEVKGESHYQDYLEEIFAEDYETEATLILDDFNEYDENAVEVEVEWGTVGYLSRSDAKKYRKAIAKLGYPDAVGVCGCKFIGGYEKDDGEIASIGVVLDLDLNNLQIDEVEIKEHKTQEVEENPITQAAPVEKSVPSAPREKKPLPAGCRTILFIILGIVLFCGLFFIGSAVFSGIKLPASPDFQKWTSQEVITQFQAAGLETGAPVSLTSEDFNMFIRKTDDATFFFIPSACEGCRGRVFAYSNKTDLNLTKSYYENLAKGGNWLYSWLFVKDNILVQMPGDIPEDIAKKFEKELLLMDK